MLTKEVHVSQLKHSLFCPDLKIFLTMKIWVEVKVDGLGGKWTVQLGESGRFKAPKVDGPGFM